MYSAKRYEQDKIMQKELKAQQLAAEQLPLETIALPPINRCDICTEPLRHIKLHYYIYFP